MGDSSIYFYNVNHVNARGAAVYTRLMSEDLKRYIVDSSYLPQRK
jgi:hypothetical protein